LVRSMIIARIEESIMDLYNASLHQTHYSHLEHIVPWELVGKIHDNSKN
jgi:hypothetical protein